mgnify:CR=1 FL=1
MQALADASLEVTDANRDDIGVVMATSGDCFNMAYEASRLAVKYMTPVFLLTDGYIANAAEPWKIPSMKERAPFHPAPMAMPTEASSSSP